MYQPRLSFDTKMVIKQLFNVDIAGCDGDVERTWDGTRDIHRHMRLAYDILSAVLITLALFALFTLRNHGIELSSMVIYGLVLLSAGVFVLIRLLFAWLI